MVTREQCSRVCADLAPTLVLLNIGAGGVTSDLSADEATELGFKIVIFPAVALGPVYEEVRRAVQNPKKTRMAEVSELQRTGGVETMFNVCGLAECMEFDHKRGGTSFTNGA
ncbi:uncharacterized protein Z518_04581 [Rhinocladiella mackenziei CBS 650.93]|uniref:Uncharacterized protein n=1 Tax=Rhinocladiella mackenziei CBS 650.93 TaxID=1442369 RepID=A0A0D2JBY2_9EURO|nr:uncharacterized protein Z518_04581 [Rhinocladiella mackenziei CBS 650.93]KIX06605.1 hypothetical protein Z518_04581 [Rhinocladiella mackenziei CBS 650.93]